MSEEVNRNIVIQCELEGDVRVAPDQVYNFPGGIVGFERVKQFALIPYEDTALFTLRAISGEFSVLVIPASATLPNLEFKLDNQTVELLHIEEAEDVVVLYIMRAIEGEFFVNQKAPIIISYKSNKGCQYIIQDEAVGLRVPLALKGD